MATVKLDPAKGVQIPNLTTTERNAISSPETGALIWNTTTSAINQYNGSAWSAVDTSTDNTKLPLAGGTMTGDLVTTSIEIAATNSGSPFNVLKFTDTDTGTAPNQAVGSIEFNSSDSGNTGVGAKIDAIAEDYDSNMAVRVFTGDPSSATEKMRITSAGNVGIGVVPETWQSTRTALQVGDSTAVWGDVYKNSWFSNNVYRNTSNTESYINASYAQTIYMNNGGTMDFKNSASGSADAAISWETPLQITADGRGLSQFTAKAWINFNGQNTVAIRDSHNVSSITDNGTGNYNVTMANAMANVNYCVTAVSGRGGGEDMHALVPQSNFNFTTTQFRILTLQSWDVAHDASYVGATVFGD
tara:strand:+ start:1956 stop:3032 length:1077 start_codon:yes stop_codon:yes gene_type:complete